MEKGRQQLEKLATGYGGRLVTAFVETGWERNPRSTLVPYVVKCYRETLHEDPRVEGIHAGLECGCWSRKIPDADIISMGPTLVHPHTTGERAELASLEKYVILTDRIVQNTAELK
jgi:dipeptidase D